MSSLFWHRAPFVASGIIEPRFYVLEALEATPPGPWLSTFRCALGACRGGMVVVEADAEEVRDRELVQTRPSDDAK